MLLLLWIAFFSIPSHAANFFVSSPFGGSHLHSIWEIATILADTGHNITFISLEKGALYSYHHPNITGYTVKNNAWRNSEFKNILAETCLVHVINGDSLKMFKRTISTIGCLDTWGAAFMKSAEIYGGDEIKSILDSTKFDVIIAHQADYKNLAVVAKPRNIPVVAYSPSFFIFNSLLHTNFPILPASQPTSIFPAEFSQPPSIWTRFTGIIEAVSTQAFLQLSENALYTILPKFGFSSFDEVSSTIKLFLTNDHVAFTFPILRPPNDVMVGAISLIDSAVTPLPLSIVDFIGENNNLPVVYVSFGTYADMDMFPWVNVLLTALSKMDVKVIVKTKQGKSMSYGPKFLPMSWVPQKDLLRSGKLKLFIGHCGNNGRIETIFFNVPVLCIPLFADQSINAELIKWKKFGSILLKEDIQNEEVITNTVNMMFENYDVYYRSMKRASDIVKNEPGNVKKRFLFYLEHLAKYKNLDYLENEIIMQQRFYEFYNLDILILVLAAFLGVLVIMYKILKSIIWFTMYRKQKVL